MSFNLQLFLSEKKSLIEKKLDTYLPPSTTVPVQLHTAMRYAVQSGGKRLRPILCLAAAESCGQPAEAAMLPAVALEFLHTYTLIHDDLPAMDNDTLRRGQPTVHV